MPVIDGGKSRLNDHFDDPSRGGVEVERLVNGEGHGFGPSCLTDMEGTAIGSPEGGGDPALTLENVA